VTIELKDRSFGDTLGASVGLVFNNILYILKYTAFFLVIFLVFLGAIAAAVYYSGLIDGMLNAEYWTDLGSDTDETLRFIGIFYLVFGIIYVPFGIIMMTFLPIILTDKFQSIYTGIREERPFSETMKLALNRFFPYFLSGLLVYFGFLGGYTLLVVPGLIFFTAWSVTGCTVIGERKGPVEAMKRSWQLTKGGRWEVFGLYFVMYLMIYMGLVVLIIIAAIPAGLMARQHPFAAVITVYSVILASYFVIYPLFLALTVIIYYNLRIRKEGFSVEHIAQGFFEEQPEEL
jgi:hypothetical protein